MTWNTVNTKNDHYGAGSFRIGSGPEVVVILGSCRVVPYFQYFDYLNADNRFTIHLINVVNFYYDPCGNQVDPVEFTKLYEGNATWLDTLARCKWFIHEHTENFGCFNTDKAAEKNIYQFGMKPEVDISIPNWNNSFVLMQEYIDFDEQVRTLALTDRAAASRLAYEKAMVALNKFLDICAKTDLPEFGRDFKIYWTQARYFWTGNHVTNQFTSQVFRMMNDKYLKIPLPAGFWEKIMSEDLYAEPHTPITKYDVENFGLTWPQEVKELRVP